MVYMCSVCIAVFFSNCMLLQFCVTEKDRDPSYGTGSGRGVYDETVDRKIREAVLDDVFNIVHNLEHLKFYCCFIFCRYFGIRGGKEVSFLKWDQVTFHIFDDGPMEGLHYVILHIDEDKGNLYSTYTLLIVVDLVFLIFLLLSFFF